MSESESIGFPLHFSDGVEIDTDRARLDLDLVHRTLCETYWAKGIPRAVVDRSIACSLCFGMYYRTAQIGFARVVTDYATFGYLADVFVLEQFRGRGWGDRLVACALGHPGLRGLRRLLLATRDAHALYARHGFVPLAIPDRFMERHRPDIYQLPT